MPFELPTDLSLTWLGHSAFQIVTPKGKRLLIDPWIANNPACPSEKKNVGAVDLMLITHGHFDHIEDAIPLAQSTGSQIVCIYEIAAYLERNGVSGTQVHAMNKGGSLHLADLGLTVTMVHADHSCGLHENGTIVYGGEAVGYVVTLDDGFAFYHSGDTAVFSDMALIAELYAPKLAMLPIGDRFVMSPREAAKATVLLQGVEAIVPMHFGTFPLLTGMPEAFQRQLESAGANVDLIVLAPGETKTG